MAGKKDWVGRVNDWMSERFTREYAPTAVEELTFPATSSFRPDLPEVSKASYDRVRDFGPRWNEQVQAPTKTSLKGYGWLGLMPTQSGGVMSEFSSGDERGSYPLVNPLLNRSEVDHLLTEPQSRAPIPTVARGLEDSTQNKAQFWADMRRMQDLDPFID